MAYRLHPIDYRHHERSKLNGRATDIIGRPGDTSRQGDAATWQLSTDDHQLAGQTVGAATSGLANIHLHNGCTIGGAQTSGSRQLTVALLRAHEMRAKLHG
jgi:hypothetical protein